MSILKLIDEMESLLVAARIEAEKFQVKGNNAAGTRLRKVMQTIKVKSQDIRNEVTAMKKE